MAVSRHRASSACAWADHCIPVVPKPWQMWSQQHKNAILPLYLLFTISWSLEMCVYSPPIVKRRGDADPLSTTGSRIWKSSVSGSSSSTPARYSRTGSEACTSGHGSSALLSPWPTCHLSRFSRGQTHSRCAPALTNRTPC